jgi:hypothetical protein
MKYLLIALILFGCSKNDPTYKTNTVNITHLLECSEKTINSNNGYVTFQADTGEVLFVATTGRYMCLQRKPRRGPQKRPHHGPKPLPAIPNGSVRRNP